MVGEREADGDDSAGADGAGDRDLPAVERDQGFGDGETKPAATCSTDSPAIGSPAIEPLSVEPLDRSTCLVNPRKSFKNLFLKLNGDSCAVIGDAELGLPTFLTECDCNV